MFIAARYRSFPNPEHPIAWILRIALGFCLTWSSLSFGLGASLEWKRTSLDLFGTTIGAAVHPDGRFFISDGFGIRVSKDRGSNWVEVTRSATFAGNSIIVVSSQPQIMFAGRSHGLLKSVDGGENWFELDDLNAGPAASGLAFAPSEPATVYASVSAGWGIYQSRNGGGTWKNILSSRDVRSLAVHPSNPLLILAGTVAYNSLEGGVLRTQDGGLNWDRPLLGEDVTALYFTPTPSAIAYAGTSSGGVFKSEDSGATWQSLQGTAALGPVSALVVHPGSPAHLYIACKAAGIFQSLDGGTTWVPANTGLTDLNVVALAIQPNTPFHLLAATFGGQGFWAVPQDGLPSTSPPTLITQPISQCAFVNQPVRWSVVAEGTPPLSYQWQRNGVDLGDDSRIVGARTSSLEIRNSQITDAGVYRVVVSNAAGRVVSSEVRQEVITDSCTPAGFVYWCESTRGPGSFVARIMRIAVQGGIPETILSFESNSSVFGGIAFDPLRGHLYSGARDALFRADLDGRNRVDLVPALDQVQDVELDLTRGKVYWSEGGHGRNTLRRANLDGSQPETLLPVVIDAVIPGIALDSIQGKIYFAHDVNVDNDTIQVMNLDGSDRSVFRDLLSSAASPFDVEIDPELRQLFWNQVPNQGIYTADLDSPRDSRLVTKPVKGVTNGFHYDPVGKRHYVATGTAEAIEVVQSNHCCAADQSASDRTFINAIELLRGEAPPPQNQPPIFTPVSAQSTREDQPLIIAITITDDTTPPELMNVAASATGEVLLPISKPVVDGGQHLLRLLPVPDAFGVATVTVTVQDKEGLSATLSFPVTVESVNDAPSFSIRPEVVVEANSGVFNGESWATSIQPGPANETIQHLEFLLTNSNEALFKELPTINSSGTLRFSPAPNVSGSATVTVVLKDDGGKIRGGQDSSSRQFVVTVNPPPPPPSNTPPAISRIPRQFLSAGETSAPVPFTVVDAETPAAQLEVAASSSNPSLLPASAVSLAGEGANRTFTISGPNRSANSVITITVTDAGRLQSSTTFELIVLAPSDEVAVIGPGQNPEVQAITEALRLIGVGYARVDRMEATADFLRRFKAVVWNPVEAPTSPAELIMLEELNQNSVSFSFIGSNLPETFATSPDPIRSRWHSLLKAAPTGKSVLPGPVEYDLTEPRHPVVDGVVGAVGSVHLPHAIQETQSADGTTVIGRRGAAPAVMLFDTERNRTVTQLFAILGGEAAEEALQRRRLFQNSIWWLLRKPVCPFPLTIEVAAIQEAHLPAGCVAYWLQMRRTGDCSVSGSSLHLLMDPRMRLLSAHPSIGQWEHQEGGGVLRLGSTSGDLREARLCLVLQALTPGVFVNRFEARFFSESAPATSEQWKEQTAIVNSVEGVSLVLAGSEARGMEIELKNAPEGETFHIQGSPDLFVWSTVEGQARTGWRLPLSSPPSGPRFFRIVWPLPCP